MNTKQRSLSSRGRTTAVPILLILLSAFAPGAFGFRTRIGTGGGIRIRAPELVKLSAVKKVTKTDAEWRSELSPDAYRVLREDGTEPANTSRLNDIKAGTDEGTFACAGCGSPLFPVSTKFESGTGWPSFYSPLDGQAVELRVDYKLVLPRTEVRCATCEGHLGHVFDDGPKPTGKRYCMNGVSMKFVRDGTDLELAKEVMERSAAQGGDAVVVKQSLLDVLPAAGIDGTVAALFLGSFVQRVTDGGGLLSVEAVGFGAAIFQFFPLVVGILYVASALRAIAPAFVDE